jgi:hypothetical protein
MINATTARITTISTIPPEIVAAFPRVFTPEEEREAMKQHIVDRLDQPHAESFVISLPSPIELSPLASRSITTVEEDGIKFCFLPHNKSEQENLLSF